MDEAAAQRLRAGVLQGTASEAEVQAWVGPGGPTSGLVAFTTVRHAKTEAVAGHTLRSWALHQQLRVEASLEALGANEPPQRDDRGRTIDTRYALPLPGGAPVRVHTRAWLSNSGDLHEATCQCAGSGCTDPPACTLPDTPADAMANGVILKGAPPSRLQTAAGDARLDAPAPLRPMPPEVLAELQSSGAEQAPRRDDVHVQGVHAADGSGAFLSDATWCSAPPACDAKTLAENRRKAEVTALREGGTLRSVRTLAEPHATPPVYGFEIEQRDGFWTRTSFWNTGEGVREVSCSCAGLACAMVRRTCTVTPQ